ncbi:GMC family oxidoreductase [Pseudokineococcus sp. 1T1Z-3]|uniref:GMC family oxidoreductase n=1 Tax=Pseudokineococcus sp. 1T1Z-3 TaxID=3132745 RepID=UPI0030999AFF
MDIAVLERPLPPADLVVVGSGIAGCEVAVRLARRGHRVVLVESGRQDFDPRVQALNDVVHRGKEHRSLDPAAPYHRYLDPGLRGVSRVRRLGGTSSVWTGKWKHLQRSDLDDRPWVPESGWPLDFDTDLLPHYRSAARDYGFGDLEAEARRPAVQEIGERLAQHGLKASSFYWEERPTRTAERFGVDMRTSSDLVVLVGATATEVLVEDDGEDVVATGVRCRSLEGHEALVEGRRVVLAAGALETARLLLASGPARAGGLGNAGDLVGRFYTDHPKHHTGRLHPGPLAARFATELQYGPKPRFCLCFSLDDATQRREELLEHVVYLQPTYERRRDRLRRAWRPPAARDGNGAVRDYRVKFAAEQAPHRASRVQLGQDRDALGQRVLEVDWQLTDHDARSMARTVELLEERLHACGLGTLDFGDDPPSPESTTDAAHQMGTTRMAARAQDGVVDTDCRVFGVEGLYVAGSAVFPTGPSYSPTFTVLALARRLADHLAAVPARR